MTVIGFNFTKIQAEKKKAIKSNVNINNNVSIKDLKEIDLALGVNKQKGIKFEFLFVSKYSSDIAEITLEGESVYVGPEAKIKEILDTWKKEKKLAKSVMNEIFNNILAKCNIQAIIISRDLGLPPPIPMPKVDVNTAPKK